MCTSSSPNKATSRRRISYQYYHNTVSTQECTVEVKSGLRITNLSGFATLSACFAPINELTSTQCDTRPHRIDRAEMVGMVEIVGMMV